MNTHSQNTERANAHMRNALRCLQRAKDDAADAVELADAGEPKRAVQALRHSRFWYSRAKGLARAAATSRKLASIGGMGWHA